MKKIEYFKHQVGGLNVQVVTETLAYLGQPDGPNMQVMKYSGKGRWSYCEGYHHNR